MVKHTPKMPSSTPHLQTDASQDNHELVKEPEKIPLTIETYLIHQNEPKDGGCQAWLQVAGAFALYFNHLGLITSHGAFQTFYQTTLLPTSTPSAISWIGSLQVFIYMVLAVATGPLFDMGHCRALLIAGTAFETTGFMLTSISTKLWQILLAQGLCIGLGTCCLSIPSMAIVPLYFRKRRALAMATATVGSGLGATVYPLLFQRLQPVLGFGWTMRVLGFVSLVTCLFALAVMRTRARAQKPAWQEGGFSWRWFIDLSAFKEKTYLIFCVAIFFNNLAFLQPGYFVQSYALTYGMRGVKLATYLLPIMNASSIPGRVLPSLVADKFGTLGTYIVVCTLSSAAVFYWVSVRDVAGNVTFAVLWGLFSGGVVALANVVLTEITPDLSRLGTRLGMVAMIKGIGSLIGPPISGAILDVTGKYLGMQLLSAFGMLMTAILMLVLRLVLAREVSAKSMMPSQ